MRQCLNSCYAFPYFLISCVYCDIIDIVENFVYAVMHADDWLQFISRNTFLLFLFFLVFFFVLYSGV